MDKKKKEQLELIKKQTKTVPLIVIENNVLHPNVFLPLENIVEPMDINTINNSEKNYNGYFVISTKQNNNLPGNQKLIYQTGTLCKIQQIIKNNENNYTLIYESLFKYQINKLMIEENNSKIKSRLVDGNILTKELFTKFTQDIFDVHDIVFDLLSKYLKATKPNIYSEYKHTYLSSKESINPFELIALCFAHINMQIPVKQSLLETQDVKKTLLILKDILQLSVNIRNQIQNSSKDNLNNFLQNSPNNVESTDEDDDNEEESIISKIAQKEFPEEVKSIVKREIKRLSSMPPTSSEYHLIENYLNTLYEFPWDEHSNETVDISKTRSILEKEHFGMETVKRKIIKQLATYQLTNKRNGTILCLHGPPGVGKTSICKSIATSLNREYFRIGLGGVSDEAEIRGHRKTYVGAMPGKLTNALIKCKVKNPLIVLDEIDKIGKHSHKGSVEAALLEVLDPEQNSNFNDHFINTPIDLSSVLFIATANDLSAISRPLRDRMDIIYIDSYTPQEKFNIAKKYLFPKEKEKLGLKKYKISLTDGCFKKIISEYTRESGVRHLQKILRDILHNCSEKIISDKKTSIRINNKNLNLFLESKPISKEKFNHFKTPGIVNGLAWTPVGGEVLIVESLFHKGSGKISVTGKLGDVMKESAQLSLTLIKSIAESKKIDFKFKEKDIHIHFPAGATPKDGPSAGITLLMCLFSLITNTPANPKIAMTGEISLKGQILPVGGIKEKVLAAYKSGMKEVLIPFSNEKDLNDLPEEIIKNNKFKITLIKTYKDALNRLF